MRLILERGYTPEGKRSYWKIRRWFYTNSPEEFFNFIKKSRQRFLLFYIAFEAGYDFLNLKGKKSEIPPFGVALLEETPPFGSEGNFNVHLLGSSLSKDEYLKGFSKIKNYIAAGDIYQVNYTVRFDFEFSGDPLSLWEKFIKTQPVPYGVYAEGEGFTIIGGSMELFLQRRETRLTSKPIKGTLPKEETPERFKQLEKELAENLMITDMVRNDLGRVAKVGSVRVDELFKVETYKTVHQLVSTVSCETEKDFKTVIEATFPPASVTGAPKRRAVEIINELEPHPRNIYCGTVGLMFPGGDFTANVSIRTALLKGNFLSYYAGGGIVWDSEGEKEWREVLLKTEAFKRALQTL
jgi:para-aminobenzoate synthetase component 1